MLMRGYWRSRVLLAGVELGLFEALARGPLSEAEAAAELNLDRRAVGILLGALAALDLVEPEAERYRLPARWAPWLLREGEHSQVSIILHMRKMWEAWGHLDEIARAGRPLPAPPTDPEAERDHMRAFITGMHEVSGKSARLLAQRLDLTGVSRLLDVGGGPGTYCIEFARRRPDLRAVLLDRPLALEVARGFIDKAGLGDRIETRPGDGLADDYGSGYDLVLMSQLLHAFGPEECAELARRGAAALAPGGRLIINEFALTEGRWAPPMAALFAVNMLVHTEAGRTYTVEEIAGFMRAAGLVDLRHEDLAGRSIIVIGTKA